LRRRTPSKEICGLALFQLRVEISSRGVKKGNVIQILRKGKKSKKESPRNAEETLIESAESRAAYHLVKQ